VVALWIRKTEKALLQEVTASRSAQVRAAAMMQAYSFSFQKAKAIFWKPCESDTPAMPSSPQRKARDRAMSCVKSEQLAEAMARMKNAYDSRHLHRDCTGLLARNGVQKHVQQEGHPRVIFTNCTCVSPEPCTSTERKTDLWPTAVRKRRAPIASSKRCVHDPA